MSPLMIGCVIFVVTVAVLAIATICVSPELATWLPAKVME